MYCGRPRGGAPATLLPHHVDLVYFSGAHIGAPLQSCFRIMRIWCILRAPTWGRPYNLVTASCGFGVFCGRPHGGAPTTLLPHYADLLHFVRPRGGAPATLLPHHADLVYFGRPHRGAPTTLLPQYADLVYFAGAHIGVPLQPCYRIMWVWCILRAPTWGRPYNLVSSSRRGGPAWPPVRDSKKAKLFCVL